MVLLKILLWIVVGYIALNILLAVICIIVAGGWEFHRRWQERKLKKFMREDERFAKLLSYAEPRDIKIMVDLSGAYSWAAFMPLKIIIIGDLETVYNPAHQEFGLIAFSHEIAHIEYSRRQKQESCFESLIRFWPFSFGCFWEEWMAWFRAEAILDSLEIKIDKQKYWQEALKVIPQHDPCPLWPDKCPKIKAIEQLEKRIKERRMR